VHNLVKKGSIIVSLRRKPGEPASIAPLGGEGPKIPAPGNDEQVIAAQEVSHPTTSLNPNASKSPEQAADRVSSVIEHARATTERLKGYGGTTIDNVTAATSSDLCSTLLGYVDKVVQLGDVVSKVTLSYVLYTGFYLRLNSKVHPHAKLAWDVLTVVHKVLIITRSLSLLALIALYCLAGSERSTRS
jgi:hypothetical protein